MKEMIVEYIALIVAIILVIIIFIVGFLLGYYAGCNPEEWWSATNMSIRSWKNKMEDEQKYFLYGFILGALFIAVILSIYLVLNWWKKGVEKIIC